MVWFYGVFLKTHKAKVGRLKYKSLIMKKKGLLKRENEKIRESALVVPFGSWPVLPRKQR
jgi:hypothetical protein